MEVFYDFEKLEVIYLYFILKVNFRQQDTEKVFTLKTLDLGDDLHFCVCMGGANDKVEIVDNK